LDITAKPYHLELLHHLTPADLPRRIQIDGRQVESYRSLTGKPKSIAIEKCHLYLGQRYVITIE
jgi:hypothetical protein